MAFPNEDLSLMLKHVFGKEIAYNEEIPEIGKENSIFFRANYNYFRIWIISFNGFY